MLQLCDTPLFWRDHRLILGKNRVEVIPVGHGIGGFWGTQSATCAGIVDGFVYLGSGVQSIGVGFLTDPSFKYHSWQWWPIFLMPFALIGALVAWRIWYELPSATRHYIENVERKRVPALAHAQPVGASLTR